MSDDLLHVRDPLKELSAACTRPIPTDDSCVSNLDSISRYEFEAF